MQSISKKHTFVQDPQILSLADNIEKSLMQASKGAAELDDTLLCYLIEMAVLKNNEVRVQHLNVNQ